MQASHLRPLTRAIEAWFLENQRPLPWRRGYHPYHVWISEVMLQQTRIDVVVPYFERFATLFPSVEVLATATDDAVTAAWSGLGYYRRARMLRDGAAAVVSQFDGRVPSTVDELLTIPGIGRYTAGAIASIAFEARAPIVDGNVKRILSRLFASDADAWPAAAALVESCRSPRDLNQGLMELGALVCTPRKPSCGACPVSERCAAFAADRVGEFPAPKERKAPVQMRVTLFVVSDGEGRVLMQRESGPLMRGMYHLPHGDRSLLTGVPLSPSRRELLGRFRHTVTTRSIEFEVWSAELQGLRDGSGDYRWIDPAAMQDVPHPSYVRKALKLAHARISACAGV